MAADKAKNSDRAAYLDARRQVKKLKDFYTGLISYLLVNSFLAAINIIYTPGYLWFLWSALGWGVGIMFQAVDLFLYPSIGRDWEERKIQEILAKERTREQNKA